MITQSEREDGEVVSLWQSQKVLAIDTAVRQCINKLWSRLLHNNKKTNSLSILDNKAFLNFTHIVVGDFYWKIRLFAFRLIGHLTHISQKDWHQNDLCEFNILCLVCMLTL